MKWLMFSTSDLMKTTGGVETHVKCVMNELEKLGVHCEFSTDDKILFQDHWDVIHTHGCLLKPMDILKLRLKKNSPIFIHTLHGSTLERMRACMEWTWLKGYLAYGKEIIGSIFCDILFSVHSDVDVYRVFDRVTQKTIVCGNGWDSSESVLAPKVKLPLKFWLFVGRGEDYVKGADLLGKYLHLFSSGRVIAVPGDGFEGFDSVIKTGVLSPEEIGYLLERAQGLVLTSRYEGLPLVVLEALGKGCPVVSTRVGGLRKLSHKLVGFFSTKRLNEKTLRSQILECENLSLDDESRAQRAVINQKILKRWKDVTDSYVKPVRELLAKRSSQIA